MQLRLTVRRTASRAAHIITVSDYSRRDISHTYGIDPELITVTPEAAPVNFAPITNETELRRIRETYGIQGDYILSLCSIQPRKNLVRLIEAYSCLRRASPEGKLPQLVLAGKRGWLDNETFRAAELNALGRDILFTGYVPEHDLVGLYSGAICFVYPSYFEGFGLPVVEAMQCGVPVIAGNRTSLPEIVGEAGLLFDPFDTKALVKALTQMMDDSAYRAALRTKGLERARDFNWKTTARLTLNAYQRAAKRKRGRE
jgi:glycosyltransferase involved in cell wall biosynthesis